MSHLYRVDDIILKKGCMNTAALWSVGRCKHSKVLIPTTIIKHKPFRVRFCIQNQSGFQNLTTMLLLF